MKTTHSLLFLAAFAPAALLLPGCAKDDNAPPPATPAPVSPAPATPVPATPVSVAPVPATPAPVTPFVPSTTPAPSAPIVGVQGTAPDSYDTVKDYPFEKRDEFTASFVSMSTKMDEDWRAASANVSGLSASTAQERENASEAYVAACAVLKTKISDLKNASADTWSTAKTDVNLSWDDVMKAYDRMKASLAPQ